MARRKHAAEPRPTIWRIPDELWEPLRRLLARYDPPARTGRPRIAARAALDAIIFRMRTGCQWNHLPAEFPADSSVQRTFQRWVQRGLFDRLWAVLVRECAALGGLDWHWQAADGALGKARFGGIKSAPTPPIAARTG